MVQQNPTKRNTYWKRLIRDVRYDFWLYLMLVPGLIYFIVFHYAPMYGVTIAFRDYNIVKGFADAPWVGLDIFRKMFGKVAFQRALTNNIKISLLKIVCGFPTPIILSLMINEVRQLFYKKFIQTAVILPHFISWFVIYGMMCALFNLTDGEPSRPRTAPRW